MDVEVATSPYGIFAQGRRGVPRHEQEGGLRARGEVGAQELRRGDRPDARRDRGPPAVVLSV